MRSTVTILRRPSAQELLARDRKVLRQILRQVQTQLGRPLLRPGEVVQRTCSFYLAGQSPQYVTTIRLDTLQEAVDIELCALFVAAETRKHLAQAESE